MQVQIEKLKNTNWEGVSYREIADYLGYKNERVRYGRVIRYHLKS